MNRPNISNWKYAATKAGYVLAIDEKNRTMTVQYTEKDGKDTIEVEQETIDLDEHKQSVMNVNGEWITWGELEPSFQVGESFRASNAIAHQVYHTGDVHPDGRLITFPFSVMMNHEMSDPAFDTFESFVIQRKAYVTQNHLVCSTINYLRHFYDDNGELAMNYAKMKYSIDIQDRDMSDEEFNKQVSSILFTRNIRKMIRTMVEDNYVSYISQPTSDKTFSDKLVFTDEHVKILLCISTALKIVVPALFHFLNVTKRSLQDLFYWYENFLTMFSDKNTNIYNKLRETVKSMVEHSVNRDYTMWKQRQIFGHNPLSQSDNILKKYIVGDIIFRYEFDRSLIAFNQKIINEQIKFFVQQQYPKLPMELSLERDPDGLTGRDKMELSSYKVDESTVILSNANIEETIRRIRKEVNVKVTPEEIQFYLDQHKVDPFQLKIVNYFYAKYFGGYQDLNLITRRQYITLMVLLKRRLQFQQFTYLPQIISANTATLKTRTIKNQRFLTKIKETSAYKQLMNEKFSTLEELGKSELVQELLSTLINSDFVCVDYDAGEINGEPIDLSSAQVQDALCDEFLNFLNQV